MSAYKERMDALANEMAVFVHEQISVSVSQIYDSLVRLQSIVDSPGLTHQQNAWAQDSIQALKKSMDWAESAEAISRETIGMPPKEKKEAPSTKTNVIGISAVA